MPGPFTTPVAFSTPFESEPDRPNGFTSKNVQEAIEEALALAIANDRFLILSQYNGNANTGRILEFYEGIDSSDAPIRFINATNFLSIRLSTVSSSATGTIGFYNQTADPSLLTPLYTISLVNQKTVNISGTPTTPLFVFPANAQIVVKVAAGSINKPHLQLTLSSSI